MYPRIPDSVNNEMNNSK